jgi:antitoxin component YwqK of YwqJK toxin-antitoxin module
MYNFKLKGKFYINEKLEYEGEFLFNRKWNGKGYDENGNVIYELKNGNGKVKEYYDNGNIKFKGEYLNGKQNEEGKEYYESGELIFEGEFTNDFYGTGK